MKKSPLSFFLVLSLCILSICLIVSSCVKNDESESLSQQLQKSIGSEAVLLSAGDASVEIIDNNKIALFQSEDSDDNITRAIVLASAGDGFKDLDLIKGDLNESNVYYFKDRRAIVLHSKETNRVLFLALNEEQSRSKLSLISSNSDLRARCISAYGYGLSVMKGKWRKDRLSSRNKSKNIFEVLAVSNGEKPKIKSFGLNSVADLAGSECTSGGIGSSQCSITESWPVENGCEVTCTTGYYACCNSNTVKCNCVQNPPPPNPS